MLGGSESEALRLLPDFSIAAIGLDAGIVLICSGIANGLWGFAFCGSIENSSDYVRVVINAVSERFLLCDELRLWQC